ncbi:glycosyl hydrolase [Paraburkholderia sp. 1N]|uniref:Glycosyl hydrolase n=1 Tax=Paraburkholderia solitsugae TaxID=2675748 RepID=A0ABX2BK27_9BURK|nr:YCF48-related protein [Paraburkholderia solitsugae]NPT40994.1 glycosyl hydrolase [Paraburkholderia solitsugae]
MLKKILMSAALSTLCATHGFAQSTGEAGAPQPVLAVQAAHAWANPTQTMLLDATHAGPSRLVAVGDHGVVILSDDEGRSWRQARQVAASSTLSAVYFADAQHGWAVGQEGVILASTDCGETWSLQRSVLTVDQPLFSVYFKDAQHGWAVGLWSLLLATDDGGHTWKPQTLPIPPGGKKADRNLFKIFAGRDGTLYIAAEQGFVLRSRDGGTTWEYRSTGNKGSLWAGTAAADGSIFVGGLLGHLYRSADGGDTWGAVDSGSSGSITGLAASGNQVLGVGLDGFMLKGADDGSKFAAHQRADRAALTAVLVPDGTSAPLLFSKDGLLKTE